MYKRQGQQTLQVDVRIIAATNIDLKQQATESLFRSDLLDRLSFDVVHLPALRQRTEDIPALAAHFVEKLGAKKAVKIRASAQASDTIALHDRSDLTAIPSAGKAGAKAFEMAGLGPDDIDVLEVHDCFTIAEIVVLEELGFAKRGEGGKLAESGATAIGGKIPVNTSGGLKSKGHPVGASGVAQIVEIVQQLRGESGERQVQGAKIGMTQNMGGTGASSVVHILEVM